MPTSAKQIENKYKLSLERKMCVDCAIIRLPLCDSFRYAILCLFYSTLSDLYRISHRKLHDEPEETEISHLDINSYHLYSAATFILAVLFQSPRPGLPLCQCMHFILLLSKHWTITRSMNFASLFHIHFIPPKAFYPNQI